MKGVRILGEIKVRGWDKKYKKMINFDNFGLAIEAGWGFANPTAILTAKALYDHKFELKMTDIELMQYTGLTDKDGKEVCRGDICIFNNQKYTVVHELGSFGLASSNDIDYEDIQLAMGAFTDNEFSGCYNDNFISLWEIYWNFDCEENQIHELEVIGNIYENPELLKEVE